MAVSAPPAALQADALLAMAEDQIAALLLVLLLLSELQEERPELADRIDRRLSELCSVD